MAANTSTEGAFGIDPWLASLQHDIESEWHGEQPSTNFYLLLASLLWMIVWVVFICFHFSRLLGHVCSLLLKRLLQWSGVPGMNHFSVGSFSVSVLSGK